MLDNQYPGNIVSLGCRLLVQSVLPGSPSAAHAKKKQLFCRSFYRTNEKRFDTPIAKRRNYYAISRSEWHVQRGLFAGSVGDHSRAIREFNCALQSAESNKEAILNRGIAHLLMGQSKDAITDFDRAIQVNENCADAYCLRGVAWTTVNRDLLAIEDLDRALYLCPQHPVALWNRAITQFNLDQTELSLVSLDALNDMYEDPALSALRGDALFSLSRFQEAVAEYTQVVKMLPKQSEFYLSRGCALLMLKQVESAIRDFDTAVRINENCISLFQPENALRIGMTNPIGDVFDLYSLSQMNPSLGNFVRKATASMTEYQSVPNPNNAVWFQGASHVMS